MRYAYRFAMFVLTCAAPTTLADSFGPAYNFKFGNHIDTHQETRLATDRSGAPLLLFGFLYVYYTGAADPVSGLPVARHPRGAQHNEVCGESVVCVTGWIIDGRPASAKFLYHGGVNGDDHPVWMVNRADIVQPGSYTHFHWITRTSSDPRAGTVFADCDKQNAGQLETQAPSAVNDYCAGWHLQLRAVKPFAFEHGGELVPVQPGSDNSSHVNLVTNYRAVPEVTSTR